MPATRQLGNFSTSKAFVHELSLFPTAGITPQPMYMVPPAHRPVYPGFQPPAAGPGPGMQFYSPAVQQPFMMPELTVKTSQSSGITTHASTSPSKPKSAASSPKVRGLDHSIDLSMTA